LLLCLFLSSPSLCSDAHRHLRDRRRQDREHLPSLSLPSFLFYFVGIRLAFRGFWWCLLRGAVGYEVELENCVMLIRRPGSLGFCALGYLQPLVHVCAVRLLQVFSLEFIFW
jgi:hypothetical protein